MMISVEKLLADLFLTNVKALKVRPGTLQSIKNYLGSALLVTGTDGSIVLQGTQGSVLIFAHGDIKDMSDDLG